MSTEALSPKQCAALIRASSCTVAMTGAGISTAAGIPDFRGPKGLYRTGHYDAERIFDIQSFLRDPREFYRFSRDMVALLQKITPTFTHRFLAELEHRRLLEGVITQNIDPLHQQAGSVNVLALHGSYSTAHCLFCGREYDYDAFSSRMHAEEVPHCDCDQRGVIKPDVVFFGENVYALEPAAALAQRCELMLVLGSSLVVYPAALLPQMVRGTLVVVNQGEVSLPRREACYHVRADLDQYFRQVAELLA